MPRETQKSLGSEFKEDYQFESLRMTALFESLSVEELREIREKIVLRKFRKNEIILHEEQTNEFMYIILSGEAKVVQSTAAGKEIILTMHASGDSFGELSLMNGTTTPATVMATRDSLMAIISKADFYALLYGQQKVLRNLLRILSGRIRESMRKIQLLNFNNAAQRIKMLFLMLSEAHGEQTPEGTVLAIRLIHQNIADMTGLTRETVTRILDRWQRSGEIKILKSRYILLSPEFESISF